MTHDRKLMIYFAAALVVFLHLTGGAQTLKITGVKKIAMHEADESKKETYKTILNLSEQHELNKVNKSLGILKNVSLADIDASCRNFTKLHIQSSYYEIINFLMHFPVMQNTPEKEKTVKAAADYLLSVTKKNKGVAPAHDTLCTIMWNIQDFANLGYKKGSPLMKKHLNALMKLKIQNGWLQLQFTHKPGMKPEVEKTAKALVGLFMAGYTPYDATTRLSLETLDKLLLTETNKNGHEVDWFVGAAWAANLYKKIGARNLKAFQKARQELIFAALEEQGSFHSNAFMRGLTLMALQGMIPESSYPYWRAKQELEAAWNGGTFSSSAIVWSKEFNASGRHSLMPAFALAGYGYDGKLFPFKNTPLKNCGLKSIAKSGTKIVIQSTKPPVLEWTNDDFRTIQSKTMKKEKGSTYSYILSPVIPFQIALVCKNSIYFSGWVQ